MKRRVVEGPDDLSDSATDVESPRGTTAAYDGLIGPLVRTCASCTFFASAGCGAQSSISRLEDWEGPPGEWAGFHRQISVRTPNKLVQRASTPCLSSKTTSGPTGSGERPGPSSGTGPLEKKRMTGPSKEHL